MIYIDEDLQNYKYLVSASDNFLILSKQSHSNGDWNSPDELDVIYHYINPSITSFKTTYTTYSSTFYNDISSQFSSSIFDRADFPLIFICNFIIILIFAFILNQLTKLVYKGGIFGNN